MEACPVDDTGEGATARASDTPASALQSAWARPARTNNPQLEKKIPQLEKNIHAPGESAGKNDPAAGKKDGSCFPARPENGKNDPTAGKKMSSERCGQ